MTLLVGQDGTGWTIVGTADMSTGSAAIRITGGYVAVASGTMTQVHVTVQGLISGTFATAYVYSGGAPGATFLAMSDEFDVSTTGDKTANIAGAIVSGNTYSLIVQCSGGNTFQTAMNSGSSNAVMRQNLVANFPYRSAPGTLPAADSSTGHEFIIWIEGTAGAAIAWVA